MNVLVFLPVWSLALRRKTADLSRQEHQLTLALGDLIRDGRAQIMGTIRQELLSGIREADRFETLRDYLRVFEEPAIEVHDYEEAAQMHNYCRSRGITGSTVDFLICAVARRRDWQLFTADRDFARYVKVLPIRLYAA